MTTETMTSLPRSAEAGPEMLALAPFYRDWVWSGTIEAGGMGPGSPAMQAKGQAKVGSIQGGLWYEGDFEQDQYLADGSFVLRWQLHWVTGWDRGAAEYRATSADNNGPNMALYRGWIDGDRLIYESMSTTVPRIRLTWLLKDPTHATWRNEYTLDGETWNLIEEYAMTVAG